MKLETIRTVRLNEGEIRQLIAKAIEEKVKISIPTNAIRFIGPSAHTGHGLIAEADVMTENKTLKLEDE